MVDSVDEDGVDEFCFGLSRGVRVWCEDGLKSVGETVVSISMTDGLDWGWTPAWLVLSVASDLVLALNGRAEGLQIGCSSDGCEKIWRLWLSLELRKTSGEEDLPVV